MSLSIGLTLHRGGRLPPVADVLAAINAGLTETAEAAREMLLEPTATWKTEVEFLIRTPKRGVRIISTTNQKYIWVDKGTKEHMIFPRKPGGRLFFAGAFSPKTKPGSLAAGPGASGPPPIVSKGVIHPGTEPRNFTKIVQEEANKLLARNVQTRLRAVMRRRRA